MATGNFDSEPLERTGGLAPYTNAFDRKLLPYERDLCELIGCTEQEYEQFLEELAHKSYIRPAEYDLIPEIYNGPETWAWLGPLLISLAVGVASTAISYFLTPKPSALEDNRSRSITRRGRTGQDRFLQSTSFDGFADLAEFGDAIPIVWTRYTGNTGGVVVAPPLVWSRAFSRGNQQAVKLVYLVGEGGVSSPDLAGVFIGNTALSVQQASNYIFAWNAKYDYDAGAITGGGAGGGFSACLTPSNSTQFGVANPIPNGTAYRVNWRVISYPEDVEKRTEHDIRNERRKICGVPGRQAGMPGVGRGYPRRLGVITGAKGQTGTTFVISGQRLASKSNDFELGTTITVRDINDHLDSECIAADDVLQYGEQFVVGEKLVKVISRSADMWQRGKTVTVELDTAIPGAPEEAIRGTQPVTDNRQPAANHVGVAYYSLCRAVVAAFRNNRRCEATEIGIKSQVWGRLNGLPLMNAIPDPQTLENYDRSNTQFSLGNINEYIPRVSMFRVYMRGVGETNWSAAGPVLAVRGATPTDQYHQIRVIHSSDKEYEFQIQPVSSAILQTDITSLYVLNTNVTSFTTVGSLQIKADIHPIWQDRATDTLNDFFTVRQLTGNGWGDQVATQTHVIPTKAVYDSVLTFDMDENLVTLNATDARLKRIFLTEIFGEPDYIGQRRNETLTRNTDRGKLKFMLKVIAIDSNPEPATTVLRWEVIGVDITEGQPEEESSFAVGQTFSYPEVVRVSNTYIKGIIPDDYPFRRVDVRMRFRITEVKNMTTTAEERGWRRFEIYTAFAEVSHYGNTITHSCDSGPEHEVVYVNQIGGVTIGNYSGVTTAMLALKSNRNIGSVDQVRFWIKSGVNNSNSFPQLVQYLLSNVEGISSSMIDSASFAEADSFCNANGLYYDGAITARTNLRSFITSTAPFFLLNFVMRNGKMALLPALPAGGSAGMFTAGNIIEGSFSLEYLDISERRQIRAEMIWRENLLNQFPRNRTVVLGDQTKTMESFDMSAFCTSEAHATKAGKYIRALRQYVTHAIKFKTTLDNANIGPGSIITVALGQTSASRFNNGSISSSGVITATQNLANGNYPIVYFKAGEPATQTATLTVNGGATTQTALYGAIFSVTQQNTYTATYLVEQVELDEEGLVSVSATEYPYNAIRSAVGI
jgi:hypothetical protein